MLKIVLFMCLIGVSVSPVPAASAGMLDTMSNYLTEAMKDIMSQIAEPVVKNLGAILLREIVRCALRLEFFTLATGNHLAIPLPKDGSDLKYHKIAAATSFFWQRLHLVEQVEEIITNSTVEVTRHLDNRSIDGKDDPFEKMDNYLILVLNKVDTMMNEDAALSKPYNSMKDKFEKYFNANKHKMNRPFNTTNYTSKMKLLPVEYKTFADWFSIPRIRKLVINKMFLILSSNILDTIPDKLTYERHVDAKLWIRLSKDPNKRKDIQKLYSEAVQETANTLEMSPLIFINNTVGYNGIVIELYKSLEPISNILFPILGKKIEQNPDIKKAFLAIQTLTRNFPEDSDVYNIDYYWPL